MLKFRSYILLFVLLGFANLNSSAQDVHLSQFYASPLVLNPAQTGHFIGNWRLINNHRRQWMSLGIPFTSTVIGFDKYMKVNDHPLSGGILVLTDKSGDDTFNKNGMYFSSSYQVLQGRNTLIIGAQTGFNFYSINNGNLIFDDQYNRDLGYHDATIGTSENTAGAGASFLDVNTGFVFSRRMRGMKPEVGLSLQHVTRPNNSLLGDKAKIARRFVAHFETHVNVTNRIFIKPRAYYSQIGSASEIMAGGNAGVQLSEYDHKLKSIYLGALSRVSLGNVTDAAVFIAGIKFKSMDIGFSYDLNISSLQAATKNQGAFEISIIYIAPNIFHEESTVPCDRM